MQDAGWTLRGGGGFSSSLAPSLNRTLSSSDTEPQLWNLLKHGGGVIEDPPTPSVPCISFSPTVSPFHSSLPASPSAASLTCGRGRGEEKKRYETRECELAVTRKRAGALGTGEGEHQVGEAPGNRRAPPLQAPLLALARLRDTGICSNEAAPDVAR